jgi:hypothetical protein
MADHRQVVSTSTLLRTGKGQLMGISLTAVSGAPKVTFYDNTAGSGTIIYEANVSYIANVTIFFPDRFAPFFATGLYMEVDPDLDPPVVTATVWWRTL